MEFSRPENWSGWPFLSSGDLLHPGIEPRSPSLQLDSFLAEPPGKPSSEKARWKRCRGQARGEGGASAPSASAALPHLQCAPNTRVFRRLHCIDLRDFITDYRRLNSTSCPASLPGGREWLEGPVLCHVTAHLGNRLPPH